MTHTVIPRSLDATPEPLRTRTRPPTDRRRLVLLVLAVAVFLSSLLAIGMDSLILFGPLLAFSTESDEDDTRRSVILTRRNLGLGAVMIATFAWFWLWQLELTTSTLVITAGVLITLPLALQQSEGMTSGERTVVLTKRSLILGIWSLVVLVSLYYSYGQTLNVLVTVCVVLPLALAASRVWAARRGRVEIGLLRHPLRRDLRPHLVQAANVWLLCALLGGVLAAGATHSARIMFSWSVGQLNALIAVLAAGTVLLAALALVPGRRVHLATNVVVLLASSFLALQLVRTSTAPDDPVVLASPLTGEWFVYNGGRSVLLNGHSPNEGNAIDFARLGSNGRTHTAGAGAPLTDYAGFGSPVLAPVDGRVVELTDGFADNPPGTNSDAANHLVIDIGGDRYVLMAHLKQGSVTVSVGDVVRRGQLLAAVGNNGHSDEPHLHLQVQDTPAGMNADRTYPMVFRDAHIERGGAWPWGDSGEVRTGDLVRAVAQ